MKEKLKRFFNLRNSILIALGLFCIVVSFYLYGRNQSKVFKDEYIENIFEEDEVTEMNSTSNEIYEEETENIQNSKNTEAEKKIIVVEIKGEVNKPDVYEVEDGSIIRDLIDMAGGLTEEANINSINRAEKLTDNSLIVIPNINDEDNNSLAIGTNTEQSIEDGVININSASISELQEITGIGETKAQCIIDYREANGGFKSIEDIKNVEGIGEKTYEKIKAEIKI